MNQEKDQNAPRPLRRRRTTLSAKKNRPFLPRKNRYILPHGVASYRLNRYLAASGCVDSRRKADEEISQGNVSVNDKVITQMGYLVKSGDKVSFRGKNIFPEKNTYFILNKPKNCITTLSKEEKRRKVTDLVSIALNKNPSAFHVGRLDRDTTGLLLFTNDRDLAQYLMHPKYNILKTYEVDLDKPLAEQDLLALKQHGASLEGEKIEIDAIEIFVTERDTQRISLSIHSGQNRVVRRIFEGLGYQVQKLDRVSLGTLNKKGLARGKWRYLKPFEVFQLKRVLSDIRLATNTT